MPASWHWQSQRFTRREQPVNSCVSNAFWGLAPRRLAAMQRPRSKPVLRAPSTGNGCGIAATLTIETIELYLKEAMMSKENRWIAGVDWATRSHQACVMNADGEVLLGLGFKVHALNPKQLDRFRDRFWMSGAKDDRRDAEVLASALRTDPHAFRKLNLPNAETEMLRALSRAVSDLVRERTRLGHRLRNRLWSYYPQLLEVAGSQLADAWLLELWKVKSYNSCKSSIWRIGRSSGQLLFNV